MATDAGVSFFSTDPALNPLLRIDLAPWVGDRWALIMGALLLAGLLLAAFTDLFRGRHIPNSIVWVGFSLGALGAPLFAAEPWKNYTVAIVMVIVFGLGWFLGGIGLGDVKLYVVLALLLGLPAILAVFLAQVLALVVGGGIMVVQRRRFPIPMGPFIYLATLITLIGAKAPARAGEVIPFLAHSWVWWLVGVGAGALMLAVGFRERAGGRLASLVSLAAPVANGDAERLIYAPGVLIGPDGMKPVSGAQLDRIVGDGLDKEDGDAVDRGQVVEVHVPMTTREQRPTSVRIAASLGGYLLEFYPTPDVPQILAAAEAADASSPGDAEGE